MSVIKIRPMGTLFSSSSEGRCLFASDKKKYLDFQHWFWKKRKNVQLFKIVFLYYFFNRKNKQQILETAALVLEKGEKFSVFNPLKQSKFFFEFFVHIWRKGAINSQNTVFI
jgi:hypothetical protein